MKNWNWSLLSSGLNLALTTAAGIYLGFWLDEKFGTKPWLTAAGLFMGFGLGLALFLKAAYKAEK